MMQSTLARPCEGARRKVGVFSILVLLAPLFGLLGGCAQMVPQTMALRDAWPVGVPRQIELESVPFFPQQIYQCGPAALATALVNSGVKITPDELVSQVYLPQREGSLQVDMLAAPRRYGIVSYQLAPRFDDLLREVAAGNPVIVLQDQGVGPFSKWHYAVVAGYDYPAGELIFRSGETRRLTLPFTVFEYTWKKGNYWAMVALPADRIPVTATETDYLAAVVAMERRGEADTAKLAYESVLKRWPGNLIASVALGNRHYVLGALEATERVLRAAYARTPDSVIVLNNLAQVLSDRGKQQEALLLIDKASALPGDFADAVRGTRELILQRLARNKP